MKYLGEKATKKLISLIKSDLSGKMNEAENEGEEGYVLTKTSTGQSWQKSSGGGSLVLDSITIATAPTKTSYKAGETFDSAGMVVTANYANGEGGAIIVKDVTVTGWSVTPSTALAITDTLVTVQYTESGVTKTATQAITVTRTQLTVPSQSGSLSYTGSAQSPTWSNYDSTKMTLGGTTSSTNAGSFTATFTIKDTGLYCWTDGTTAAKSVSWSIAKIAATLSLSKSAITLKPGTLSATFTITTNSSGTISVTNDNTSVCTASRSGTTVTVTSVNNTSGTANIKISVAADTNHNASSTVTCVVTAQFVSIYGVSWDGTSSTTLSRTDAAASFTDPVAYMSGISNYGSPFDNLYPWNGMVKSTRSCGTVVAIPKFWYKLTQNGTGVKIQIADAEVDGYSVCPACMDRGDGKGERDVVYVGRYHCATSTYKSTTGVKPAASATRSAFRTSISNLGSTVWQWDFATRFTIWLLYIVEYANWNSQAVIGYGCGNNSSTVNMGYTDSMPYHTGTTQSSRTTYASSTQYRYIEGLWDNVYDWLDGCYYNSNGLNIILKPANFSDSSNGTSVGTPLSGYPSALSVKSVSGTFPCFIPSSASGSSSTYIPDDWGFNSSFPCLYVGGYYSQNLNRGLFFVDCDSSSSSSDNVGSRLLDLGT